MTKYVVVAVRDNPMSGRARMVRHRVLADGSLEPANGDGPTIPPQPAKKAPAAAGAAAARAKQRPGPGGKLLTGISVVFSPDSVTFTAVSSTGENLELRRRVGKRTGSLTIKPGEQFSKSWAAAPGETVTFTVGDRELFAGVVPDQVAVPLPEPSEPPPFPVDDEDTVGLSEEE